MYRIRFYIAALLVTTCGLPAFAQYEGNTAAKAAYRQGEKARESGRYAAAAADYQKAISLDPNFAEAYQQYFFARHSDVDGWYMTLIESGKKPTAEQEKKLRSQSEKLTQSEIQQYESLARQHPDKAI